MLWARSGNRCAKCKRPLVEEATPNDDRVVVGEECHIYAQGVDGPRSHGPAPVDVHHHSNLILLCGACHTVVDGQESTYTIETLTAMRDAHEQWVDATLGGPTDRVAPLVDESPLNEWGESDALPGNLRSDDIFEGRLADAFPGASGLVVCEDPAIAVERLAVLLRRPLQQRFFDADGTTRMVGPLWWFRGGSCMHIEQFDQLDERHCLLDVMELNIRRVAAFRVRHSAKHSFLYVETNPDPPVGVYRVPEPSELAGVAESIGGYYYEEYAIWNDRPITRRDYDDGATLLDGRPVRVKSAELRQRFLTPYNFIVCGNRHVINEPEHDRAMAALLNRVLAGSSSLEDLATFVEHLPVPTRYMVE